MANLALETLMVSGIGIGCILVTWGILYSINKYALRNKVEIDNVALGGITIRPNKKLVNSARIAYIELTHRKISLGFEEKYDSISEIYDSYYAAFKILRDLLKDLHISGDEGKLYSYISNFTNNDLRNHLTKYQAKYRSWLEKQRKSDDYTSENDIQKTYEYYGEIITGIQEINKKAVDISTSIKNIAYKGGKKNAKH